MESILCPLTKVENKDPFRKGMKISPDLQMEVLSSDLLKMAKSYIESEFPYFPTDNIMINVAVLDDGSLEKVEFGLFGPVDKKNIAHIYSRFGTLKRVNLELLIYNGLALVGSGADESAFNPNIVLEVDHDELRRAGVQSPDSYLNSLMDMLRINYSFSISMLEQKAFDLIFARSNSKHRF